MRNVLRAPLKQRYIQECSRSASNSKMAISLTTQQIHIRTYTHTYTHTHRRPCHVQSQRFKQQDGDSTHYQTVCERPRGAWEEAWRRYSDRDSVCCLLLSQVVMYQKYHRYVYMCVNMCKCVMCKEGPYSDRNKDCCPLLSHAGMCRKCPRYEYVCVSTCKCIMCKEGPYSDRDIVRCPLLSHVGTCRKCLKYTCMCMYVHAYTCTYIYTRADCAVVHGG